MNRRYFATLAGLLVLADVAWAQTPEIQPTPASELGPPPSIVAEVWDPPHASPFTQAGIPSWRIFTFDAEYVLWFLGNPNASFTLAATDALSNPLVRILENLGAAEHPGKKPTSGGRFAFGCWQVEENPWNPGAIRDFGVEAVVFFVGERGIDVTIDRPPALVRPFFDLNNRQESGFVVAAPGFATGQVQANAQARLWGAEANVWKNVYYNTPGTTCSVSMLAGFRFLSGDTSVELASTTFYDPGLPPVSPFFPLAGNRLTVFDSFSTRNRFYGGQIGIASTCWPVPRLAVEASIKLALGATSEDLTITGNQVRTLPSSISGVSSGGLFALPSNIGEFNHTRFAQVPEAALKLSYDVINNVTISTGLSALYWSRLARAAQQIDRDVDITQIPNFPPAAGAIPTGLARPGVTFVQSDLWLVGLSFGVELKW